MFALNAGTSAPKLDNFLSLSLKMRARGFIQCKTQSFGGMREAKNEKVNCHVFTLHFIVKSSVKTATVCSYVLTNRCVKKNYDVCGAENQW